MSAGPAYTAQARIPAAVLYKAAGGYRYEGGALGAIIQTLIAEGWAYDPATASWIPPANLR